MNNLGLQSFITNYNLIDFHITQVLLREMRVLPKQTEKHIYCRLSVRLCRLRLLMEFKIGGCQETRGKVQNDICSQRTNNIPFAKFDFFFFYGTIAISW